MEYCVAALLIIFAGNFAAERFLPPLGQQLALVFLAGLPVILTAGQTLQSVHRAGTSVTFHDPYFYLYWFGVAIATLATTATALLGRSVSAGVAEPIPAKPGTTRTAVLIVGLCAVIFAVFVVLR